MTINICGVSISLKKNILFGLTKIFGVGKSTSNKLCNDLKIFKYKKFYEINEIEFKLINNYLNNLLIENQLKIFIKKNIQKIYFLKNYKCSRHVKKLPCRGQRTKTNAKTRKKINHEKF
ncbi:ribosomal protein S13 [Candidatus Carsonella ruddii CS isolate Thao2000]|uniref:Small ribosomal subunit protein uS13m n=1 Tax=Candidatus Carsonella ruddii CS isolate Thao2000 TaxID=1202537 RepID=J7GWI1_CARRU|nr:30S ribosomal protein S13 [Candidatus Carsonella ruddii]AFP83811.1 ribosomal protein S13 [Candidatus Carsonella ruddii CS isolate Thao2000]